MYFKLQLGEEEKMTSFIFNVAKQIMAIPLIILGMAEKEKIICPLCQKEISSGVGVNIDGKSYHKTCKYH